MVLIALKIYLTFDFIRATKKVDDPGATALQAVSFTKLTNERGVEF